MAAAFVIYYMTNGQGGGEFGEVVLEGGGGEVIEGEAFAAGGGAFDHFAVRGFEERVEDPVAGVGGGGPIEAAVGGDAGREIDGGEG